MTLPAAIGSPSPAPTTGMASVVGMSQPDGNATCPGCPSKVPCPLPGERNCPAAFSRYPYGSCHTLPTTIDYGS